METKQQTQATTIENLRLETGWKFNALLIKETECMGSFRARSERRGTTKICHLRVLDYALSDLVSVYLHLIPA